MQQWAGTIFYLLIFMGILYFLMIRPQQKQQKQRQAMLASLKVDDRVVLAGGLHGRITKIKDNTMMVRIADKVEVEVDKAGVAYVPGQEG
ncbi:preprotein translocase subunit YajC [Moorella sp. Hama-1]|uniref:preprotein translocase subunit YajC n=1 Tax=Moorella sp. Hama-1 TaxID=2138101 RepID=UPI000D654418|nr:preprotein translocase subunit YajC [Moorella sp. Hama-1]BCV21917.1 preprotein translocase subunit YajC [Moorella sp. Hama-1]